jgi:hypothetical protein
MGTAPKSNLQAAQICLSKLCFNTFSADPLVKKPQLKGWRKRWEEQNLDRRVEKSLQTLQRIKDFYQLEERIRALRKELGDT